MEPDSPQILYLNTAAGDRIQAMTLAGIRRYAGALGWEVRSVPWQESRPEDIAPLLGAHRPVAGFGRQLASPAAPVRARSGCLPSRRTVALRRPDRPRLGRQRGRRARCLPRTFRRTSDRIRCRRRHYGLPVVARASGRILGVVRRGGQAMPRLRHSGRKAARQSQPASRMDCRTPATYRYLRCKRLRRGRGRKRGDNYS